MTKAVARVALLALLLCTFTSAKFIINDHIIAPKAVAVLDKISNELTEKTGVNAFVVATKEKLPRGVNLYDYSKKFENNISKPYVILIFAPNSTRIGLIPSSDKVAKYYDSDKVKSFAIDIVVSEDSNALQSKYDLAVVQAYSELADEIAATKGIELTNTLNDPTGWIIDLVRWIVWIGAILIFWVYFGRPIYMRIKNGKK